MEINKMLAKSVSDISYVNEAMLLLMQLMSRVQKVDALMLRMPDHTKEVADVLKDRRRYEVESIREISGKVKECLNIAGDMVNDRDISDDGIIALFDAARDGLTMIIEKTNE